MEALLTPVEASKILRVPVSSVMALARRKQLKSIRMGLPGSARPRVMFSEADLMAFIGGGGVSTKKRSR